MPDCCVQNCDNRLSDTAYFKFPVHNPELLQKWLQQIGRPNWQPNENSYICATHFCSEDIVSYPHRRYLVLKENALPTIVPKQMNNIAPLRTQKPGISSINNCTTVKSSVAMMPSLVQSTPLVLTPTIVDPITTMNPTLLPLSNTPQRFRKILPKLNQNSSAIPILSSGKDSISSNTPPNSYIIIIPTFDNTKPMSALNNPPKLPSSTKKKPILRVTVNRKYDMDQSMAKTKSNNDNVDHVEGDDDITKSDLIYEQNDEENINNTTEEVVIKHETSNKFVVFSLDAITGEISVSYRDNSPVSGRNTKLPGTHMKLRENPRKRKIWEEQEELGNMYKRVKKDCSTLRSRLQILRKKHKKEQDAIVTLQKKLAAIETNQVMTPTTEHLINSPATNFVNIESKNKINESKLSRDKKENNSFQLSAINKQLQLTLNNNRHMLMKDKTHMAKFTETNNDPFIWRTNEKNGHCDFMRIDEATVTIQTSDVKTLDSCTNINDFAGTKLMKKRNVSNNVNFIS